MIADIIILSIGFLTLIFILLFFTCYSAMCNCDEYLKIIQLYNDIFKKNIDITIVENSTFKGEIYKEFSYGEYRLIYWGINDNWSMHKNIDCVICNFSENWFSGLVTCFMYRKINKYLREKV